jgi:hypothetical protein
MISVRTLLDHCHSISCLLLPLFLFPTEIIDVNIAQPERNREIQVFHFTNVKQDGVLHNGFELVVYGDMRDVNSDKYQAFLCSEHEILVEIPSIDHAFLYEPIQLTEVMKKAKAFCDRAQELHDVTRNRMIKHKKQQTKRLLLRFPRGIELTNHQYSPKYVNGEILESEFVPYHSEFELAGAKYKTSAAWVSWKVAIVESEKREISAADDTNRATAKLAAKLRSMHLS